MSLRGFRTIIVCYLVAACCVLTLLSCGRSPSAPGGRLQVYVSQDGVRPAAGKKIEIRGTLLSGTFLSQSTDANGLAVFIVHAGRYVVRAYEIGTPGPGRLFVEQSVEVDPAGMSEVHFNDCTMCASPSK